MKLSISELEKSPKAAYCKGIIKRESKIFSPLNRSPRSLKKSSPSISFHKMGSGGFSDEMNPSIFKLSKTESVVEEPKTPKIAIRVRPLHNNDELESIKNDNEFNIMNFLNETSLILNKDSEAFKFNKIYTPSVSQTKFYEDFLRDIVLDMLNTGKMHSIVVFGEKKTGKKYTVFGENNENSGVLCRVAKQIFTFTENYKQDYSLKITLNELNIEEPCENVVIDNLKVWNLEHFNEYFNFCQEFIKNKEKSFIFSLEIISQTPNPFLGKLHFIIFKEAKDFQNFMIFEKYKKFIKNYINNVNSELHILITCSSFSEDLKETKFSLSLAENYRKKVKLSTDEVLNFDEKTEKLKQKDFEIRFFQEKLSIYQEAWNLKSNKEIDNIASGVIPLINECFSSVDTVNFFKNFYEIREKKEKSSSLTNKELLVICDLKKELVFIKNMLKEEIRTKQYFEIQLKSAKEKNLKEIEQINILKQNTEEFSKENFKLKEEMDFLKFDNAILQNQIKNLLKNKFQNSQNKCQNFNILIDEFERLEINENKDISKFKEELQRISRNLSKETLTTPNYTESNHWEFQSVCGEYQYFIQKLFKLLLPYKYNLSLYKSNTPIQIKRPEFLTYEDFEFEKCSLNEFPSKPINSLKIHSELSKITINESNDNLILTNNEVKKKFEEKKNNFEEICQQDDKMDTEGDIENKDNNIFSFVSLIKPKRFIPNYVDNLKQTFSN